MAKRHKPEEIVTKLRQVDVLVSQRSSVADAIRGVGVTEVRCSVKDHAIRPLMAGPATLLVSLRIHEPPDWGRRAGVLAILRLTDLFPSDHQAVSQQ